MSTCNELEDIEWLTGDEAGEILADLASDAGQLHTLVARLRRRLSAAQTHLLLEQVELRRRAAAKFTHAERLFFTRVGLEQSTDQWVAHYKAQRIAQRAGSDHGERGARAQSTPHIADLCCGIGGDLMALTECVATTIAIDRDPVAAYFASTNSGADVRTTDINEFNLNDIDAWHIDPDRRPSGKRTTSLEYCQPGLDFIEGLLQQVSHAAIKLAPATKPPREWIERCELEWISRDGECKQLVAWHGNLATTSGERRATIITSASGERQRPGSVTTYRTITGQPNQSIAISHTPDRYIFDVDPAVTAARLTGVLAAELNLNALSPGPTYLTRQAPIDDDALSCFEVTDVLPMRVPVLAQHLRASNIGHLEIKKRGVDFAPEKLRRDLKLKGSNAATLLITLIAGKPTAILAQRLPNPTQ